MKKVWISILNQGTIHLGLADVLLKMASDNRYKLHINYPDLKPDTVNRNRIVADFLESGYDYLLMIDDDTVPLKNPLDLVELDKDIINFAVPQWREGDVYWVALDRVKDGWKPLPVERRAGLQEVDATGSACILIKREVFEKIDKPFFMPKYGDDGIKFTGQDYLFCEKAKKQGFKVWVHFDYIASHFKEINILEILKLLTKNSE